MSRANWMSLCSAISSSQVTKWLRLASGDGRDSTEHERSQRCRAHGSPCSTELPVVTDRRPRNKFEQLTQALLDTAIEVMDLSDGDGDFETTADELEQRQNVDSRALVIGGAAELRPQAR